MTRAEFRYVVVGGGMAADAAARGIRSLDENDSILVLTDEPHPPYDRPPLSKGLWSGMEEERIWRGTEELEVEVRTDVRVAELDPEARTVRDEEGRSYGYGTLLLATGARPRRLEGPDPNVLYFRTLDDYRALRERVEEGTSAALLGAGFIGCELASSLTSHGASVSLFYPEDEPLGLVLPSPFAALLGRLMRDRGVRLHPGVPVRGAERAGRRSVVLGEEGPIDREFDLVAAGLGVIPNHELAGKAELEANGGIQVDDRLRTSAPDVYAAGDVASFPVPFLGERLRVEHEDHANESGMQAGRNMAGADEGYDPLPYFYSEIFGVYLEVVGVTDGEVELHPPDDPEGTGAAVFRKGERARGVLVWNRAGAGARLRRSLRDDPRLPTSEVLDLL